MNLGKLIIAMILLILEFLAHNINGVKYIVVRI